MLRSRKQELKAGLQSVSRAPRVSQISCAVLACFAASVASASPGAALVGDTSLTMAGQIGTTTAKPPAKDAAGVTRVDADRVAGRNEVELTAEGRARLRRGDLTLTAERLRLDQIINEVIAEGNVRLQRDKSQIEGPRARVNLDTWQGEFEQPVYRFQRAPAPTLGNMRPIVGSGQADLLQMEGQNQFRLSNSTYTTCVAPSPDWYLRVHDLKLDYDRARGEGYGSTLVFKDVPIAYMPWVDFPLNGSRQSGLLPPTFGHTSSTGLDLSVPYYINLAPNYDATIAPRWMGERGTQLGGEFRYLNGGGRGVMSGEWLQRDQVTHEQRGLFSTRNSQDLGNGLSGTLDFTQVSDRDYFADLSSRITSTSQATLNQQASVSYSGLPWLSTSLNVQRYQTLVGEAPYDRLPQVRAALNVPDVAGVSVQMPMEYTRFKHPTKDNGGRMVAYPQLSLPVVSTSGFFTPKIGMHVSEYDLSRQQTSGPDQVGRTVPVGSLDTGLNFERDLKLSGRDYTQTLEPRLYYVRAAYRDQSNIPVFDSARADFNFSQLFSENIYAGNDRIADANQLTTAVTSRFIDNESGAEDMRVAFGQRFYFSQQRVTLPGETPRSGRVADWLALVSGRVSSDVSVDNAYQYNPRDHRTERGTLSLKYQPQPMKAAALSYRYQRATSSLQSSQQQGVRDIDLSMQWPLIDGWYAVGRYDYNLKDHKLSEAIAGFEYKADCWILRTVWQTLLNTTQKRNNAIFIQLEFSGLASVGSSPVQLLRRSVSGYSRISNNSAGDPVFGNEESN